MTKTNIIVVEDEFIIQKKLKITLEGMGYQVIAMASEAEEAIRIAEGHKPGLILMDIKLRGKMDGIEAANIIKERFNIPVIFTTAYLDEERVGRAKLTHPYGYLIKPIQERDLKVSIEMALYAAKVEAERREAEKKLRQSEERFRNLAETSQGLIFKCDREGRFTYLNPGWEHVLGYQLDEMLGQPFTRFKLPELAEQDMETFKNILNGKDVFGYETVYKTKSGKLKNLVFNARLVKDENGIVTGTQGTAHDITQRKQAEVTLRKLSTAVEQNPASVVITDLSGAIEYVNPEFEKLTGYSLEEAEGKNPCILKSGEHSDEFYEELWETISTGKKWSGTFHNRKKNGELYWESAIIASVKDKSGEITNYVAVKKDITEKRQIEQEREKTIIELQEALDNIKTLEGLLPICASCKKIRDDGGYWNQLEGYIENRSDASFTHSICPECAERLYGDTKWFKKMKDKKD